MAISAHTDTSRFLRWKLTKIVKDADTDVNFTAKVATYKVASNLYPVADVGAKSPAPASQKFYAVAQAQEAVGDSGPQDFNTAVVGVIPRVAVFKAMTLTKANVAFTNAG